MALKSWLASLKVDVSDVSGVQANIHAGLGRYVTETAGVSGVSGSGGMVASDTADTAAQNQTYQPEPAYSLGCTADTVETCKKTNVGAKDVAVNDPALSDLNIQASAVTPDPAPDPDRWCCPVTTAMSGCEIDTFTARLSRFTDKGVTTDDGERLADKLLIRDRESDDRRFCLECWHLIGYNVQAWHCGNWQAAGVAIRQRDNQLPIDLVLQLQRCNGFSINTVTQ